MPLDVVDLRSFYGSPLGHVAQRTIAAVIRSWWLKPVGLSVAGCGFALPYLEAFRDDALRLIALMPAQQGIVHWPPHGTAATSATALVEPDLLPLPDGSMDRILLVHMLEVSEHPRDVLEEVWRVLAPGGRLITVAPNRRGWWASVDTTPFGVGQPFSRRQIAALLRDCLFSPERAAEVLYVPPYGRGTVIRMAGVFERVGGRLGLPGAGIHVVEATKQLYRPIPLRKAVRRPVPRLEPALAPAGFRRSGSAATGGCRLT